MSIIDVSKNEFEKEVLNEIKPIIIDFNANWCGPCRMLKPILEKVSNERNDYKFVSINIDEEEELSDKFGISSIPCLVIIKNGREVKRSIGFKTEEELNKFLEDK